MLAFAKYLITFLQPLVEKLMLNMLQLEDAKGAEDYFGKSDSGYYIKDDEMRREWGGKAAEMRRPCGMWGHCGQARL
jgi:hypothetical protein